MTFVKDDLRINRAGRPKDTFSLVSLLKKKLQEEFPEGADVQERKTYAEKLIETMMERSITKKDTIMIRDIINRIDGMPTQKFGVDDDMITEIDIKIRKNETPS